MPLCRSYRPPSWGWCGAVRKALFLKGGGNAGDFEDIDPWDQQPAAMARRAATSSGSVKESVLKMSALVDQMDDSELLPPKADDVQVWMQRYFLVRGAEPEEEEDPTEAQLAGLYKRVMVLKQTPYVDFGVWWPFARGALKVQKFRVYMPLRDGTCFIRGGSSRSQRSCWGSAPWRLSRTPSA